MTPVTGPRVLVREGAPAATASALARGMAWLADEYSASSVHITFCSEDDASTLTGDGRGRGGPKPDMLLRTGMQYHWHNAKADGTQYTSFDDFLGALTQKRRNAIRKERRGVARAGYSCRRLRGTEITPALWEAFYTFYQDTTSRKWGRAYLTREFFLGLSEAMGDSVMLVVAQEDESGEVVAAALNIVGAEGLYGRNWGCKPGLEVKGLHMCVCYYEAIAAAIDLGLDRGASPRAWHACQGSQKTSALRVLTRHRDFARSAVEAGAQGEHKLARGYMPAPTLSAHYMRDPRFRQPIARAIGRERGEMDEVRRAIRSEASPFKDGHGPPFDAMRYMERLV